MNELVLTKTQWKKYIQEAHGNTKEAMLEEAKRIAEYKANCDTKRGGSTFAQDVEEWCGYKEPTARQLAKVGADVELRGIATKLPEDYTTCYLITTLPTEQRDTLPISPSLTRAQVKNWKTYGQLEAPKDNLEDVEVDSDDELEQAAMLIPPLEDWGLSGLGKRAMDQARKKLNEGLHQFGKSQHKKVISFLIDYMKYWQDVMRKEIRRQVPDAIKARERALDERERRLELRERLRVNGAENAKCKLILGVLHPDKAPNGLEAKYAKAFNAFKELTG